MVEINFHFPKNINLIKSLDIINIFNKKYIIKYNHKNLEELINKLFKNDDFIIIDKNIYRLNKSIFINLKKNIYILDGIEENKNIKSVLTIIDILLKKGFSKNNKLLVIGGGITHEVGGFTAAIYKRGLKWIFIPTTIISMAESGNHINLNRNNKNMLGLIYSPDKIIVSDYFLYSLKKKELISGLGELLKLSLNGGEKSYLYFIENLNFKNYFNLIKMCSLIRKKIIELDPLEKKEYKIFYYGHTIGHALETTSNFYIPHGIAILIGMLIKNILFCQDKHKKINDLIESLIPVKYFDIKLNYNQLFKYILLDKKNKGNKICFIYLIEVGKFNIKYIEKKEIEEKLKNTLKLFFKKIY